MKLDGLKKRTILSDMRLIAALLITASAAGAENCPALMDTAQALAPLFDEARTAPTETAGQAVSAKMWQIWLKAPNAQAQEILDRGMRRRGSYDYVGAAADFQKLIEYCPNYAEGYNQRAFVRYLQGDFPGALVDLDKTLSLSPNHVGAQSGRALTLMHIGNLSSARKQMLEALENNPWLSERSLLAPGAPLGPVGQDL